MVEIVNGVKNKKNVNVGNGLKSTPVVKSSGLKSTPVVNKKGGNIKKRKNIYVGEGLKILN